MTINHHLTDDLIRSYSAGILPEAMDLIVATHISLCDECRAALCAQDAVGGAVLERARGEAVSDACLDRTLALIRGSDRAAGPARDTRKPDAPHDPVLPAPLRDYVGGSADAIRWRPVGMGVKQAVLRTKGDAKARLLRIPAGAAMPDHSHRGIELTMVLKGAYSDADGRYARGDIEIAHEDLHHTPVADVGEDCICLAVNEGPLRFKGILPRLAQPFLGI
ncbi:ChrR family anti-sigma-E factor [Citreimonas salinaria]|uniref:Anti-ECFsigma factor, ChrR n=1 Tax=Citreimonas salinaria TaxID=321339 RepID=A0A1H3L4Y6_9RHOB|nr:ChrR family anti-sigma-E factor [Citreimonas salinaria]SDY59483.1 anti-ECFsigma factor, ChrR [Citreimonas salinaria]